MKNKKMYIIIIIIILLYFGIMLILNYSGILKQKDSYIVFSDTNVLKIENKKMEFLKKDFDQIENKKFDVYDYNKYMGKYNVKLSDNTYKVYDDNYNLIKFQNNFLATYSDKYNISVNESEKESLNQLDEKKLLEILKKKNISSYTSLLYAEKRKIKIEGTNNAYIYNVSNDNYMNNDDIIFSIVYVYKDNEYIIINFDSVPNNEKNSICSYYLEALIDINNDGTDEIILNKQYFSQNGTPSRIVYGYDKKKFKELISIDK